jgi:hypothetical protein
MGRYTGAWLHWGMVTLDRLDIHKVGLF